MKRKISLILIISILFLTGFTVEEGLPDWCKREKQGYISEYNRQHIHSSIDVAMENIKSKGLTIDVDKIYISPYYLEGVWGLTRDKEVVIAKNRLKTVYHELGHVYWNNHILFIEDAYKKELEKIKPGITNKQNRDIWEYKLQEGFAENFASFFTGEGNRTIYPNIPNLDKWLLENIENIHITRGEVVRNLGRQKDLIDRGVLQGYEDGLLHLDRCITRSELATLLVRHYELKGRGQIPFSDVKNTWDKPYIETLYKYNLIKGYPDNTFKGDKNVTRREFYIILERMKQLDGIT